MSKNTDVTKLEFIIEKIENLLNSKIDFDATNICILQIKETLK